MKNIKEEGEAMGPTNSTAGVASLNPNDPRNPPVFKKKKFLKDILKRTKVK